ncbi:MAG: PEGA domain-containing protein [Treponema sp.]|nr:PEGA domain-containing protein [Treponema sp.]
MAKNTDEILLPEKQTDLSHGQTKIILRTNKQKARIYLNNTYQGISPLTITDLVPGIYFLMIKKEGYTPYTTTIQVLPSYTQEYYIQLVASSNTIR